MPKMLKEVKVGQRFRKNDLLYMRVEKEPSNQLFEIQSFANPMDETILAVCMSEHSRGRIASFCGNLLASRVFN